MPSSPCSPPEVRTEGTVATGSVAASVPFTKSRIFALFCSTTRRRPSGRNAMLAGRSSAAPAPTVTAGWSTKPVGTVAARGARAVRDGRSRTSRRSRTTGRGRDMADSPGGIGGRPRQDRLDAPRPPRRRSGPSGAGSRAARPGLNRRTPARSRRARPRRAESTDARAVSLLHGPGPRRAPKRRASASGEARARHSLTAWLAPHRAPRPPCYAAAHAPRPSGPHACGPRHRHRPGRRRQPARRRLAAARRVHPVRDRARRAHLPAAALHAGDPAHRLGAGAGGLRPRATCARSAASASRPSPTPSASRPSPC